MRDERYSPFQGRYVEASRARCELWTMTLGERSYRADLLEHQSSEAVPQPAAFEAQLFKDGEFSRAQRHATRAEAVAQADQWRAWLVAKGWTQNNE